MKMKQLAAILVLSAAVSVTKAQNVTIGPSVGLNHSWQSNLENSQFKPGLNVGAFLVYSIDPHWGLGADVRYSMEGAKTKLENNLTSTTYRANLNYVRIPVKGIYFFGQKGNKIRPKLYAGPTVGFLVGGNTSLETDFKTTDAATIITKTKSKDSFKGFDFGVVVGTGFNYRIHPKGIWLNVDVNYTHGVIGIAKNANMERENRNLMASVGVGFPLGTF